MALRLTTPHDLSRFALSQLHSPAIASDAFAPRQSAYSSTSPSVSILSDAWRPSSRSLSLELVHALNICYDRKLWHGSLNRAALSDRKLAACSRAESSSNKASRGKQRKTPIRFLEPPYIAWIDPLALIPHEHVDLQHVRRLIDYLKQLDPHQLLPVIIVTQSHPHVILDGHHRWKASIAIGIQRVPCWMVDDSRADNEGDTSTVLLPVPRSQYWNASKIMSKYSINGKMAPYFTLAVWQDEYDYYKLRVYDTSNDSIIRMKDIAQRARDFWWQTRQQDLKERRTKQENTGTSVKQGINQNHDVNTANEVMFDENGHPLTLSIRQRTQPLVTVIPTSDPLPTYTLKNNATSSEDAVARNSTTTITSHSERTTAIPVFNDQNTVSTENKGMSWGIKGTKHVAIRVQWPPPSTMSNQKHSYQMSSETPLLRPTQASDHYDESTLKATFLLDDNGLLLVADEEERLEKVAPKVEWGLWRLGADVDDQSVFPAAPSIELSSSLRKPSKHNTDYHQTTSPVEDLSTNAPVTSGRTTASSSVQVVGYYGQGYIINSDAHQDNTRVVAPTFLVSVLQPTLQLLSIHP